MKNSDPEDHVTMAPGPELDVVNSPSVDEDALQVRCNANKEAVPLSASLCFCDCFLCELATMKDPTFRRQ